MSDYYPAGPTLYVIPGAWCDSSGAVAGPGTNGLKPRNSRRRALAEAGGPPSVTVHGGANCFITGDDAVSYRVGNDKAQTAERARGGAWKIALPNDMADVRGRGFDGFGGVQGVCGLRAWQYGV